MLLISLRVQKLKVYLLAMILFAALSANLTDSFNINDQENRILATSDVTSFSSLAENESQLVAATWQLSAATWALFLGSVVIGVYSLLSGRKSQREMTRIQERLADAQTNLVAVQQQQAASQEQLNRLTVMTKVFELLSDIEVKRANRAIYEEYFTLKDRGLPAIFDDTDARDAADLVESRLNQVSVLVQNGMIDEELFFKIYGGMFVRIGKALQDDISNAQTKNTHYCEYFVELKTRFEKRFPKDDMPEPYRPPKPGY